jgi:uncharacterized surface protein with fasciclin (FAS1) repeats
MRTTVVDIIANSDDHNTLEAAIGAAGLTNALRGDGPFTVFAPTDAAFDVLPAGTIDALLSDPQGALTDILLYHVVAGKVMSTDLSDGMTATTLLGKNITVTITEEGVFINGAQVTVADIVADNGVVHVIDAVLLPERVTVVDVIVNSADHNILEAAVLEAGLAETLSGDGPFTVFAPTDAAFAALPEGTIEALLADPLGALTDILTYHVVGGKVMSTDLSNGQVVQTLSGKFFTVTITAEGVFINKSRVTVADIETDNGVVHVIDAVLVPDTPTNIDEFAGTTTSFRMYPNPASTSVTIDLGEVDRFNSSTVSIVNMDGRVIETISVQQSRIDLNVSNLNRGMYMVILRNDNGISSERLIVR